MTFAVFTHKNSQGMPSPLHTLSGLLMAMILSDLFPRLGLNSRSCRSLKSKSSDSETIFTVHFYLLSLAFISIERSLHLSINHLLELERKPTDPDLICGSLLFCLFVFGKPHGSDDKKLISAGQGAAAKMAEQWK